MFIGCGNKENCFLCDGYGKLPCAVCEKNELKKTLAAVKHTVAETGL